MKENNNILTSAMHYAIPLGLFWCFRYLFLIWGESSGLAVYIANILSIGTPVLYYVLLTHYKDHVWNGKISYGSAVSFSFLLFAFASFLELVMVCLHIFIISPEYLADFTNRVIAIAEKFNFNDVAYMEQMKIMTANIGIYYLVSWFLSNMIVATILSFIFSYFISRSKSNKPQS